MGEEVVDFGRDDQVLSDLAGWVINTSCYYNSVVHLLKTYIQVLRALLLR